MPKYRSGKRLSFEDIRTSVWFWPMTAAAGSALLTLALLTVRPAQGADWVAAWAWPADREAAGILLQVVATATMAAASVIFSLTVVALQLASQQFSPRLLREFTGDRVTQSVLAVLISTFVVSLTGLRGLAQDGPLPVLVLLLVQLLAGVSAGALLVFVGHIVRFLRVDTMMVSAHKETVATIDRDYPEYGEASGQPQDGLPGPGGGTLLSASASGFIRTINARALVAAAREDGVFLRLGVRPGDHVIAGAPVGSMWPMGGTMGHLDAKDRDASAGREAKPSDWGGAVRAAVRTAVELGFERTNEQDAALGLRQLTDIAVKAISPGINDPVTAVHAVGYCADLLCLVQGRRIGPRQYKDDDGVVRLVCSGRDHLYFLDLVCGPIRRFGCSEPMVLGALLRMLRDCAVGARDDIQRKNIAEQADLVLEAMDSSLLDYDAAGIRDLAHRVGLALAGEVDAAYRDRAGETRSV